MRETKQHSSLPLILATAGAVFILFSLGWLLLNDRSEDNTRAIVSQAEISSANAANDTQQTHDVAVDIPSELRNARLAASAGMLVSPVQQNALYYYSRILTTEPGHVAARRELDNTLAQLSTRVSQLLTEGSLEEAYGLARPVESLQPDHPLVGLTQDALNRRANELTAAARRFARNGENDRANAALTAAAALPAIDPRILSRGRRSVAANRRLLVENEDQRVATEQAASAAEWEKEVRGAIKSGRLLATSGDNATDLLARYEASPEAKAKLGEELFDALLQAGQTSVERGDIADAEAYVDAASGLRANASGLDDMRLEVERKAIALEESRILGLKDFVRISTPPARYPRSARLKDTTGWVDVLFTVTTSGDTADIEIMQAEPATIFDRSAIDAVRSWSFEPRQFRGQPINQRASVRLKYTLE